MSLKSQATNENKEILDFIKIKNVCVSNDTMKKVKRQPINWKKVFTIHISNKRLVSRI